MDHKLISATRAHGGEQQVWQHHSQMLGTDMSFSVYVPPHTGSSKLPVIWYLSGLTCTASNVTEKGEFRKACSELGLIFVAPDTSPRGDCVPDDPGGAYDFGLGAGFYVNARQEPWSQHYQMRSYIEDELPTLIAEICPADMDRQAITGHSMGGHGALTIGLRNPDQFRSISAFAPICAPSQCAWGHKALDGYLGADQKLWREYDACALIEDGARAHALLVDQGTSDDFLESQLKPELLRTACARAGQTLTLRLQDGYDHSYFFISTFLAEHLAWHRKYLE